MDKKGAEGTTKPSLACPTKSSGPSTLRNFTIPRKKPVLEPCPKESWDYSLIQSKLRESRLDTRKEDADAWLWRDIKLVHNEEFLTEFSEKRSEMRKKGRNGREMEERFCFLVASYEATSQVYQHGLRTEKQDQYSLGKPSHGVYLYKHVDVALKQAAYSTLNGKHLIIFKALFGKVKKVTPSLDWNRTPDPIVAFDCHVSKDAVSHRDSLSQQILGSSVFLFDYTENQELNKRPRQCLPYAVVCFDPAIRATPPKSISPPVSPGKHPSGLMHDHAERFRGCTVAERRGRGENATVTFKHYATQSLEYKPHPPGEDASLIQQNEPQSSLHVIPQQLCMPLSHAAESISLSLPHLDSVSVQSFLGEIAVSSNLEHRSPSNTHGSSKKMCEVTPKPLAETVSTIVYSSRMVKDPRLSRQEKNIQEQNLEEEKDGSASDCNEQACSQNQEEKTDPTIITHCKKQSVGMNEEHREDKIQKSSLHDPHTLDRNPKPKAENLPSIKLFKMKFQKYAAYFKMTEKERHENIMSQENLTSEQKQLLIDRIHFYEVHYQRYMQGLMFQRGTETDKNLSSSHVKPKNNKICLPTQEKRPLMMKENTDQNQSNVTHSIASNVSNFTSTVGSVDSARYKVDMFSTDNDKITDKSTECTANTLQEKKEDFSADAPEFYVEPQDESVLRPVGEVGILEQSLDKGLLLINTSEKNEAIENKLDCEKTHWYSRQDQANDQAVSEGETPRSSWDYFPSETTLSIDMEQSLESELHNITAVDGENCVDTPATRVSENNDLSSTSAMRQEQQSQISLEKQNGELEFKTLSKSDDHSEMSIVIKRRESSENTIQSSLYERLKLDQLLSDLNGATIVSKKSYLIPKDMGKTPFLNQQYNCFNEIMPNEDNSKDELRSWTCGDDKQFIVMSEFKQLPCSAGRLTLSERFSKLRAFHKKPAVIHNDRKFTNSYTAAPTVDGTSDLEALIPSSEGGKGRINNNAKLIQLMTQRYNERSLAKCGRFRKHSEALWRKTPSSGVFFPLKRPTQSVTHVLTTALHIKKTYLQKAKKTSKTKLISNKSSRFRALFSKLAVDLSKHQPCTTDTTNTNLKEYDSCLNVGAISQSSDPPRHHINSESSKTFVDTNISSEDCSCLSTSASENKQDHDDGFVHISLSKEQSTASPTKHTTIVCSDVSGILSNSNIKKSQGTITSDFKGPVLTYETEPERGTSSNRIRHRELPSPVTSSGSSELFNADVEGLKEECKSSWTIPKEPREEECDTKEISTDYNAGTFKVQDRPPQAFSSNPAGITSGSKIGSYSETKWTAKTPDLPRIINDEKAETEGGFGHDSVVDATSGLSCVTTPPVVIMANVLKTGEANVRIQSNDLHNGAVGTDTNGKELSRNVTTNADQSSLNSLKDARDNAGGLISPREDMNHPSESMPSSQDQSVAEHAEYRGLVEPQVKTMAGLNRGIITDTKEADAAGDLHASWQWRNKNSIPNMSETQLITKLRDYLTKFEVSVKKQESVDDSVNKSKMPMAWITLDSTVHKRQLLDMRHYNRPGLTNIRHGEDNSLGLQSSIKIEQDVQKAKVLTEALNNPATPTKTKTSKGSSQTKSRTSKRRRRSKEVTASPHGSSALEAVQKKTHSYLLVNKNTDSLQTSATLPNTQQHWIQNHTELAGKNLMIWSQGSGDQNGPNGQQGQVNQSEAEKVNETNKQAVYEEQVNGAYVQIKFSVQDISNNLKLADHARSVAELHPLQLKCKRMLHYFISNFERDQQVSFDQSCVSRNLILEKYFDRPPAKVELKFEAVNSFLELQMMMEAWQFVENKVNFLRRKPTFRSLLWYDPTLYGELYKGAVGFQQQSSLFSMFQQCLSTEGYGKLQEYHVAVSTLHQQLQDSPDTSYYMYLKSKRERLEIEAALRNPQDISSFFLSVPIAAMINFGNSLESLEKVYRIVMTFVETPSDCLPGIFDVGKAEHLSILCRYLQEKMMFLKSCEHLSKVSWFGLEHLLYDASKVLAWGEYVIPNKVLAYKRSNQQIIYGVTEAGIALVNTVDQHPQFTEAFQLTPQQQKEAVRKYRNDQSGRSTDRTDRLSIQSEGGNKETHGPNKRRATHPPLRCNDGGFTPLIQTNLAAQFGNQAPYTAIPKKGATAHCRMAGKHAWDQKPPNTVHASTSHSEIRALLLSRSGTVPGTEMRTASVTNMQNSYMVRQQQWPPPPISSPAAVGRMLGGTPHLNELPKDQRKEPMTPMVQPCSFPTFPLDTASVVAPAFTVLPFTNTLNYVPPHSQPIQLNYPYFVFNGQTYSTVGSTLSTSGLDAETQLHPHPV
ncbi:uncharacterized protein tex15 isoform X2 [Brachyhypopomus gauderio]|uniref:uncharacterized protein tex15 isoform X2 n=1 Tax=Brachyhypopomus gauderio TaxID=698409 RepID=UPI004042D543